MSKLECASPLLPLPSHSIRMYRVSLTQWSLRKVLRTQKDCSTCVYPRSQLFVRFSLYDGGIHLTGCVGWKRDAYFLSSPDPANKILSYVRVCPSFFCFFLSLTRSSPRLHVNGGCALEGQTRRETLTTATTTRRSMEHADLRDDVRRLIRLTWRIPKGNERFTGQRRQLLPSFTYV